MDIKPVIVGVDGAQDSVRALQWAAAYARAFDAPLHILTAFDIPTVYGPYAMAGWENSDSLKEAARDMLAETVRTTLTENAEAEQSVLQGHPAEVLVNASQGAQLVVVGSRGRGGIAGMLLGSVSQHVVAHAHCPVVVMPHSALAEA